MDEFVLVTTDPPDEASRRLLIDQLESTNIPRSWIGINELPQLLGVESPPGDLRSPETTAQLQLSTLVENLQRYSNAPIGPLARQPEGAEEEAKIFPQELFSLQRQFSYAAMAKLLQDDKDLSKALKIGECVGNVTVVLSDIKNFSSLVKASGPDDLQELMERYYLRARKLVWAHNGLPYSLSELPV